MNKKIKKKNWNHYEIKNEIKDFIELYKSRPIKNNRGGMLFPHMFAFYFILKKIKPKLIIESGIYKGQSTWLIEKTLPKSDILSIDTNLKSRTYISKKVQYSDKDFKFQNFSNIPKNTLVFFDDHVNHLERIKEAHYFNIKNLVLEDNYNRNSKKCDFYTIKQAYENSGFKHQVNFASYLKTLFKFQKIIFKKIFFKNYYADLELNEIHNRIRDRRINCDDYLNLKKNIKEYFEFPSIIDLKLKNAKFLFKKTPKELNFIKNELYYYNYITYIKIK
jgi:predicted HTH domain antitoxin